MNTGPLIKLQHVERFYPLANSSSLYVLRDINLEDRGRRFRFGDGPVRRGKIDRSCMC